MKSLRAFNNPDVHIQSWHIVATSDEIKKGRILSKVWLGQRIAIFRGQDGKASVVEGQCTHLGANLGHGCVIENKLRCGFHHYVFERSGNCQNPTIPSLFVYPAEEKYGFIWAFNGPVPLFPIPNFPTYHKNGWIVEALPSQTVGCHPHIVASNGLDAQHLLTVHKANLSQSPEVDLPNEHCIRLVVKIIATDRDVLMRFLKVFGVQEIRVTFSTWGGNLATSHAIFGPFETFLLFANQPIINNSTESRTILMVPCAKKLPWKWGFDRLLVAVIKPVIKKVLKEDVSILEGIKFRENFTKEDAALSAFVNQVNQMPTFERSFQMSNQE